MYIVKLISAISWLLFYSGSNLPVQKNGITWLSLQEAETAMKKEYKPLLIDLYTNWCGWCKVMDKKTYGNRNVTAYLSERYYAVKLNAESKDPVSWGGRIYNFNQSNQTNDIALYLTQGRLAYPTTIILTGSNAAPQAIPGYLSPKEFEIILKYFGENKFGLISFEEYRKDFRPSWK